MRESKCKCIQLLVQLQQSFHQMPLMNLAKVFPIIRFFYTKLNEVPATLEEFVEGTFAKHINNNGGFVDQLLIVDTE